MLNIDKQKIIDILTEELKKDRSKTQVEGFTKLDLMELTRKHICSHKNWNKRGTKGTVLKCFMFCV